MSRGRILFLTHHFPLPGEPGAPRPWAEAGMLRDLGFEVTVVTAGTHYLTGRSTKAGRGLWETRALDGLRIVRTAAPPDHRTSLVRRALNYLSYSLLALFAGLVRRADFVFVGTDPVTIVPVAFALSRIHRAALVLDERDLTPDTQLALGLMRPGRLTRSLDALMRAIRRRSTAVVAATPGIAATLRDKGVPDTSIVLMQNAFPWETPEISSDRNPDSGDRVVVFFGGGMGLASDLLTVLSAAGIIQSKGAPLDFVFMGDGDRRAEYLRYCEQNDIRNCRFPSMVPRLELARALDGSDICVHSLPANPFWECALSSKVVEYLIQGKPVVFSGSGVMAELLAVSGGGISVPPGDPEALATAFLSLADDPATRAAMGTAGRNYIRRAFSRDAQMQRLKEAFVR